MDRRTAKELLHVRDWLDKAQTLVAAGREAYDADERRQEAGDSLMMKLGEGGRTGSPAPTSTVPKASAGEMRSPTATG